ncbi:predicted protein [Plenodomus lingam JN3]|uniref:Predicted protein n=1 Tax=Leptosphaeria maculans (strain JN3 / isolate v23.1.3 / race Av1-4-5-6-7-8) TaxID=985895 RepID=E4ZHU1_LEPMJ|nr:predicted protein [Plenodomus lingam JN3]CBX90924.1 predicted protein [Plenodomus lingam JN3]
MNTRPTWTERLREHCLVRRLGEPTVQDISDRRGGRTAWSSVVIVDGVSFSARYWYDGSHANQAKEDAAEVALRQLTGYTSMNQEPPPASHYRGVGGGQGPLVAMSSHTYLHIAINMSGSHRVLHEYARLQLNSAFFGDKRWHLTVSLLVYGRRLHPRSMPDDGKTLPYQGFEGPNRSIKYRHLFETDLHEGSFDLRDGA